MIVLYIYLLLIILHAIHHQFHLDNLERLKAKNQAACWLGKYRKQLALVKELKSHPPVEVIEVREVDRYERFIREVSAEKMIDTMLFRYKSKEYMDGMIDSIKRRLLSDLGHKINEDGFVQFFDYTDEFAHPLDQKRIIGYKVKMVNNK